MLDDTIVDPTTMRQVLGRFCTGIVVVTASTGTEPIGFTAQSFTSLSLDPPLVSVCVAETSSTYPRIRETEQFCVNVLGDHQRELSQAFASKGEDRFAGVGWRPAPVTGSPVLDDSLAWVDCTIEAEHPAGDHLIVVGRVHHLGSSDGGAPLLFFRGSYCRLETGPTT